MNQRIKVSNSYVLKFLLGNNLDIVDILLKTVNNRFGHEKLKQFINYENCYQNTPLHQAGRNSNVQIVEALKIAHSVRNHDGWIALHDAAHHGELENVKVFVQCDFNCVKALDKYKRTALHEAAYAEFSSKAEEYCKIVKFLLNHGSEINAQDKDGFTPLHSATRCGHLNIVEILVEEKADINIVDHHLGVTPLYIAVLYGHFEIVKYLLSNNALIDSDKGLSGASKIKALHIASILPETLSEGIEIFEFLLRNSDINAKAETSQDFFQKLVTYILSYPYADRYRIAKLFRNKIIYYLVPVISFTAYDIASWLGNEKLISLIESQGGRSGGNWLIGSGLLKNSIGLHLRHYYMGIKNLIWSSLNIEETRSSGE
jgi:ankyrin repeat protein